MKTRTIGISTYIKQRRKTWTFTPPQKNEKIRDIPEFIQMVKQAESVARQMGNLAQKTKTGKGEIFHYFKTTLTTNIPPSLTFILSCFPALPPPFPRNSDFL